MAGMRITSAPSTCSRFGKSRYCEVINVTSWPACTKYLIAYLVTVDPPPPIGGNSLFISSSFMPSCYNYSKTNHKYFCYSKHVCFIITPQNAIFYPTLLSPLYCKLSSAHNTFWPPRQPAHQSIKTENLVARATPLTTARSYLQNR